MPLRSLTNSPLHSPQLHWKTQLSVPSDLPLGSDESEVCTTLNINDGICDARRVTSDQSSPLGSICEYQANHVENKGSHKTEEKALHRGSQAMAESQLATCSVREGTESQHRRGWSLNDLDCLSNMQPHLHEMPHQRSSSSKEALEALSKTIAYPHLPLRPPPHRRSTPDGIPSFGTLEAQKLRLVQPSWLHRLRDLILGRPQHLDENERVTESTLRVPATDQSDLTAVQHHRYGSPTEMLRRASGMTRPIAVTEMSVKSSRSRLPRGVRQASVPGDLATAADGSHVRGRFGQRVSGHGVGQRTIDVHPLARRQGTSAVEEEVYAINKACDQELQREQYQSSTELPGSSLLERGRRQNLETRRLSELNPSSLSRRYPLRITEDQTPRNAEMHGAIQTISPSPHILRSLPTHRTLLSQTQNRHMSFSSQADYGTDHILSSRSDTVHLPFMTEPAPYAVSHSQPAIAQTQSMIIPAVDDRLEQPEQDQVPAGTDQTRNLKTEIEIC